MKFTICTIMKNEANVLPRLGKSLRDFISSGGEWVCVDTGSTDGSVHIAKVWGAKTYEVESRFIVTIGKELADKINERFVIEEEPIVKENDSLFDFASARNYSTSLASNDMVLIVDADEYFTAFDFEKINSFIETGIEMFWTPFVFAHDIYGKPTVQFHQNRFYNKTKMQYEGIVHEVPMGEVSKTMTLPDNVYMLEHKQELGKNHRPSYLTGLALDCYEHQDKDRQSHYFARELMYTGRYKSAIREFERHISMSGWPLEAAQSMIFIGDCYGRLGKSEEQVSWYFKSFHFNSERREALIRLAEYYKEINNLKACVAFATAALEIPHVDYYANDMNHYRQYPHELLYYAYGWLGDIANARKHIRICLTYQPDNPVYKDHLKYYYTNADRKTTPFKQERVINRLALPITRGCNRRCPECTAVEREGYSANPLSIEELQDVGRKIGYIEKIEITGGEPSFHPNFKFISENLHKWFNCKDIMLLTNGWLFKDDNALPILLNYDRVYITHYTSEFADWYKEKPNTELVEKVRKYLEDYPHIQFWEQIMNSHVPNKEPVPWADRCIFDYDKGDMISYHEGQLYGCCTSWQLDDRGRGIPLSTTWRKDLNKIELPCSKCFLGKGE